jgi:hypothetical protein
MEDRRVMPEDGKTLLDFKLLSSFATESVPDAVDPTIRMIHLVLA